MVSAQQKSPSKQKIFTPGALWLDNNDGELTFHSQSTYVLPVAGKKDAFIFMADRWNPGNPIDGRYVWLPIVPEMNKFRISWKDSWDLSVFK